MPRTLNASVGADLARTLAAPRPAQAIVEALFTLRLTGEQIARAVNVSAETVSSWRHGRTKPDDAAEQRLDLLRATVSTLLHIDYFQHDPDAVRPFLNGYPPGFTPGGQTPLEAIGADHSAGALRILKAVEEFLGPEIFENGNGLPAWHREDTAA